MASVFIEVREDGVVRVSVGGLTLSLVEDVILTARVNQRPQLTLTFVDPSKLSDQETRRHFVERVRSFELLAGSNPFVTVSDRVDTLPSSMEAVKEDKG